MFEILTTALQGCLIVKPRIRSDARGRFVKTLHKTLFSEMGLESGFCEQYHSTSARGVLRGLHFQTPPHDHVKLVTCLTGEVLDALVDLRVGSPTYGVAETVALSGAEALLLYIPRGIAHGFCTRSEEALMLYNVTSEYAPTHDTGIRWDSVGIAWPGDPVVSERDAGFVALAHFESPFRFEP